VLLGGVSSALARSSHCPLLVVPRGRGGQLVREAPSGAVADAATS